jgi:hypothetical protein
MPSLSDVLNKAAVEGLEAKAELKKLREMLSVEGGQFLAKPVWEKLLEAIDWRLHDDGFKSFQRHFDEFQHALSEQTGMDYPHYT